MPVSQRRGPGFELMTSRSRQYTSCHWDACFTHSAYQWLPKLFACLLVHGHTICITALDDMGTIGREREKETERERERVGCEREAKGRKWKRSYRYSLWVLYCWMTLGLNRDICLSLSKCKTMNQWLTKKVSLLIVGLDHHFCRNKHLFISSSITSNRNCCDTIYVKHELYQSSRTTST